MSIFNLLLIILVFIIAIIYIFYYVKKKQNEEVIQEVEKDDKTYTLEKMRDYVKKRLDEITKINLYDIGLSEEELKRRKSKKYALKKALKGCTYGDVNDKRYVKELISDLLAKEYGVDETNISKAIPFDVPSLLTAQDKFDIIIYMYEELFEHLATDLKITKVNQTKNFISISLPVEISNNIDGDKLFIKVCSLSRKFRFSMKNKELIITLDTINLDKHYIYYLIDLLNIIKDSIKKQV